MFLHSGNNTMVSFVSKFFGEKNNSSCENKNQFQKHRFQMEFETRLSMAFLVYDPIMSGS